MNPKYLWSAILIAVLCGTLVTPARASKPVTVLIVIASTTLAAAVTVFVALGSTHHHRKKIAITGCIVAAGKGLTLTDEEDKKRYALSGDTTGVKPGDRMTLQGKKMKPQASGDALVWETQLVVKDFGVCRP